MTLRSALVALAALALADCAPLAVGGEWRTGAPLQREGWTISNASLRFDASGSIEISARVAPAAGGCALMLGSLTARWFVNAAGQTVVAAGETACAGHATFDCGGRQLNPCHGAAGLVTVYVDRGGALVSADGAIVRTR